MRDLLRDFINDSEANEFFITGSAGTGKTTSLISIAEFLAVNGIPHIVTAFTNTATNVLAKKLPTGTHTSTLHSFLKKRPTINSKATNINALTVNTKHSEPEVVEVLLVDEFSFIGEEDYMDIGQLQEICLSCGNEYCGCSKERHLKVIYIGDPNQLNPVNSYQAVVVPNDYKYHIQLTKIHRQEGDEDINLVKLKELVSSDSYEMFTPVETDFLKIVKDIPEDVDTFLAYTNNRVQEFNAMKKGRQFPKMGDVIYNSTMKKMQTITDILPKAQVDAVNGIAGEITEWSKYNPLKTLKSIDGLLFLEVDNRMVIATWFGSSDFNIHMKYYGTQLISKNRANEDSKKEYKYYKTVNDYVSQVDFPYAITIHKAQGREYDSVVIDYGDLVGNNKNIKDINRLLYVAISRAKNKAYLINVTL